MFINIRDNHNNNINNGQSNQNISIFSFFINKTYSQYKKEKQKSIHCRIQVKSFCKPSLKNHYHSSLRSTSQTFYSKSFFNGTGQHKVFNLHQFMKKFLLLNTGEEKSSLPSFQMIPEQQYRDFSKSLLL